MNVMTSLQEKLQYQQDKFVEILSGPLDVTITPSIVENHKIKNKNVIDSFKHAHTGVKLHPEGKYSLDLYAGPPLGGPIIEAYQLPSFEEKDLIGAAISYNHILVKSYSLPNSKEVVSLAYAKKDYELYAGISSTKQKVTLRINEIHDSWLRRKERIRNIIEDIKRDIKALEK